MTRLLTLLFVGFVFAFVSAMPIANATASDKKDNGKPVAAMDNAMKNTKDTTTADKNKNAPKDKKGKDKKEKGKNEKGKKGADKADKKEKGKDKKEDKKGKEKDKAGKEQPKSTDTKK